MLDPGREGSGRGEGLSEEEVRAREGRKRKEGKGGMMGEWQKRVCEETGSYLRYAHRYIHTPYHTYLPTTYIHIPHIYACISEQRLEDEEGSTTMIPAQSWVSGLVVDIHTYTRY